MKESKAECRSSQLGQKLDNLLVNFLTKMARFAAPVVDNHGPIVFDTDDNWALPAGVAKQESTVSYVSLVVDPMHATAAAYLRDSTPEAIDSLTDEEIELGENIRKHFIKKFTWKALGGQVTPWQGLALKLVSEQNIPREQMGMLVKLPWFYTEDKLHDELRNTYNFRVVEQSAVKEYTLIKIARYWHGKEKMDHFWLADEENYLHCIPLNVRNPAYNCIKAALTSKQGQPFKLRSHLTSSKIKELRFTLITNYQFEE